MKVKFLFMFIESLEPAWKTVPKDCKKLVKKMLLLDIDKRIAATDALKSTWIMKHTKAPDYSDVDLRLSLLNLKKFKTQMFFQRAVLTYLASQKMSKKDEEKLRKTFEMIDTNKDGFISKAELVEGYKAMHKKPNKAKRDVKSILLNIDLNNNGNIDYNGKNFLFT